MNEEEALRLLEPYRHDPDFHYKEYTRNYLPHREDGPAVIVKGVDATGKVWQHMQYRLEGNWHRQGGPAILGHPPIVCFENGTPLLIESVKETYRFRGIEYPREWAKHLPSAKTLMNYPNADVRAVGIEMYGIENYIRDIGAKLLDADLGDRFAYRELYHIEGLPYRIVLCGDGSTKKSYSLPVPIECETVAEAGAVLNGALDEFVPAES
jgi:hypothetical protein